MPHPLSTQYGPSVPSILPLGPSLLSLMRQDLPLRLNLASVVMIATKVTNPALVSLIEATYVRGDEAPGASEQANDVLRSCNLDQYLNFHTNHHNLVCHLPKLRNFVSCCHYKQRQLAHPRTIIRCPQVIARFISLRTLPSHGDRRGWLHNLSSHEGCSVGLQFHPSSFALLA